MGSLPRGPPPVGRVVSFRARRTCGGGERVVSKERGKGKGEDEDEGKEWGGGGGGEKR